MNSGGGLVELDFLRCFGHISIFSKSPVCLLESISGQRNITNITVFTSPPLSSQPILAGAVPPGNPPFLS